MKTDIPNEVRELLREHLRTPQQLAIVMLLRHCRDNGSTLEFVCRALGMEEMVTTKALEELRGSNLLDVRVEDATRIFRYAPGSPELEQVVDRLATMYAEDHSAILRLLSDNAIERIRAAATEMLGKVLLSDSVVEKKKEGGA